MKKILFVILIVLVFSLTLIGCFSEIPSTQDDKNGNSSSDSIDYFSMDKEEFAGVCKTYKYETLMRNPADYQLVPLKVSGIITQVEPVEDSDDSMDIYYLTTDKGNQYVIFDKLSDFGSTTKYYEDDRVRFYGLFYDVENFVQGNVYVDKENWEDIKLPVIAGCYAELLD